MYRLNRSVMLIAVLLVGLMLAACSGNTAPTPTAAPEDEFIEGETITMTPPPGKVAENKDFAPSNPALVAKTGRPQVVMFFASWCEQCHAMAPIVFKAQDDFGAFVDFIYLDIDAENTKALRDQYAFNGQRPTIIFLDAEGQETGRLVGVQSQETFDKLFDPILTVG
jgi:thiol:disulfide interchange protein